MKAFKYLIFFVLFLISNQAFSSTYYSNGLDNKTYSAMESACTAVLGLSDFTFLSCLSGSELQITVSGVTLYFLSCLSGSERSRMRLDR